MRFAATSPDSLYSLEAADVTSSCSTCSNSSNSTSNRKSNSNNTNDNNHSSNSSDNDNDNKTRLALQPGGAYIHTLGVTSEIQPLNLLLCDFLFGGTGCT